MDEKKINLKEAKKFDKWMKKTVKSVYYSSSFIGFTLLSIIKYGEY